MSSILNRIANYQHSLSTKQNNFRSIVGLVQFSASEDVEKNFETNARLIEECAEKGAQMVCLPEHFAYMHKETMQGQGKMYDSNAGVNGDLFQRYK